MGLIAGVGDFGLTDLKDKATLAKDLAALKAEEGRLSATLSAQKAAEAVATANSMAAANAAAYYAVTLAQTANLQGVRLGVWNPGTNTQNLTTDASAVVAGGLYDVVAAGTSSITGTSVTYVVGDRIAKVANVWVRLPFSLAETNKYKTAQILRSGGDLSINTTNRTLTVTGTVYILRNNTFSTVNSQASTAWLSPNISGINYILFNHTTNQFAIVNYSQSASIDVGDYAMVGFIGTDGAGKLQVNISGSCLVDGVTYPLVSTSPTETNKYKIAKVLRGSGDLSINTTARTLTVTGEVFVLRNNTYSVVSSQASTAWLSSIISGINYILFNHVTNQFAIVRYDQSASIDVNNYAMVGFIGTDGAGKLQVNIEGSCLVDGVTYPLTGALTSETNKYKIAKVLRNAGDLSINTTARTLTVTGQVFILRNNTYSVVSSQASTAWLSSDVGGINYILFNHVTNQFAIVRYDQSASIDVNNYAMVGFIGTDGAGKLQVNIEGSCLVDGVTYPLVPVQSAGSALSQTAYHTPLLGALDNQGFDTDYSHIIFYGQSLSAGSNAEVAITTTAETDSYMIGDRVWITKGNNNAVSLSPLAATMSGYWGESPAISTANAFKRLFDYYHRRGTQTKFITTNCGDGGKSIELLSKECTNGYTLSNNLYQSEFILAINRAKTITNGLSKTISCPVIVYMQGENNYVNGTNQGLVSGNSTNDKAAYKAYLLLLKNNMQADAMSVYGQTKKPLFFIYQTAGSYINNEDMSINMAQIEFANENADVILLNPTYQTPDYSNQHLTANGYRMYGESIAKSLYRTLIKGEKSTGVVAKKVAITSNYTLEVDFLVPVMPLAFDTLTTDAQTSMGFKVRNLGVDKAITSTVIVGNKVIITTTTPLASGSVEVAYAGLGRNGQGNLRDSDTWASMYNYYDDSALTAQPRYNPKAQDGTTLYGKKYPCYNFCSNFYFAITY